MTYAELVQSVLEEAFPEGIATNLAALYRKRVLDGWIELQRLVPQLLVRQWSLTDFTATLYRQGMSILNRPAGKVKRLGVFSSKTLRDLVYYDPARREDLDRWIMMSARSRTYPDAALQSLGHFAANAATDKGYRSERGVFCLDGRQILLAPHLESTERVLVEWEGSTTAYADTDVLDFGKYERQVINALVFWLKKEAARREDRSTSDYQTLELGWRQATQSLALDAQSDASEELPQEDLGAWPRGPMPAAVLNANLGDSYDPNHAYLHDLFLLCPDNQKFYNFGALLFQGQVVEEISGPGQPGGLAELTYQTLRVQALSLSGSDGNYYRLVPQVVEGGNTHAFDSTADGASGQVIGERFAVLYLDVYNPSASKYVRFQLALVDGDITLAVSDAPATVSGSQPPPVNGGNPPADLSVYDLLQMKDLVTGRVVYVTVKDGQFSLSDARPGATQTEES